MKKRFGAPLSLSPSTIFANGKKNFSAAKMVSSGRPTLRTSPKKKNKSLPKVTTQSSSTPSNITPIDTKNLKANNLRPEEEEADNEFSHGAIAGPSSPTRRRRRPSASRRRSSSITAAAALISSYSTRSEEDNTTTKTNVKISKSKVKRRNSHTSNQADDESEDDDENDEFGGDATETVHEARKALGRGRASPYHMALVQLLFSLAQGMPLASQFKVYTHLMCRVYQLKVKPSMHSYLMLPPAPELPSDPVCQDVWVEDSTSTYAAAMATVGALVSLILLNRCSKLSEYFGRKPLLLATHILLAISTSVFRISVLLPTYVGVTVLYVAVMVMEASAGAPLKIAVQNYVVDTTSESQRAGALSFTDGFGQIGAFPSSTLGGWLAASTQQFFAPFYASIAVYVATTAYMLVFVPESKKRRHHTLIDDFERIGESEENGQKAGDQSGHTEETDNDTDADTDGGVGTESYFSSVDGAHAASRSSWWQKLFYKVNFLAPLSVFLPYKHAVDSRQTSSVAGRDWRLFVLALIVVLEESFQVFMVPILLLYNTKVFKYDVVQNGYLVSLLQGVRALYLTVCFPWLVTKIRTWLQSRKKSQESSEEDETDALIQNALSNKESDNEKRGKLDLVIMLLSYILATASLALMAFTRSWSDQYEKNKGDKGSKYPPWVGVAIAIVGLQIGAGATSLRTALLVNAVSEQEDTREALRYREQRQTTRQNVRKPYGSTDVVERRTSYQSTVTVEGSVDGTENSFNVHHDRHQSKALAANQILCTAVYAFVPLLTSRIFGIGLNTDRPELVWMFKAGMAGLSAVATFVLILLYGKSTRRS